MYNNKANIITTTWNQLTQETLVAAFDHSDNLRNQLFNELDICPECGHHHNHNHEHEHHHNHKCKHEHHHADEIFTSWSKQTPKKYTKIQLETILKKLSENSNYGNILRAKGYVDSFENNWLYFDLVSGEYEIRIGKANFTGQICVIGEKLDEQKLNNLFDEVA